MCYTYVLYPCVIPMCYTHVLYLCVIQQYVNIHLIIFTRSYQNTIIKDIPNKIDYKIHSIYSLTSEPFDYK